MLSAKHCLAAADGPSASSWLAPAQEHLVFADNFARFRPAG
jgi:hypothetical protein